MPDAASQGMDLREFVVREEEAAGRLDLFLARHMPEWSRSQLQRLIRSGRVRVGSRTAAKAGEKVESGERIVVHAEPERLHATPEPLALNIVYEDDDFAVIDKPSGMTVHVGAGAKSGTLVNALLHHLGEELSDLGGEARPGIVHRLDKMTSGLILVAKNNLAHRALADQFKSRSVRKQYQTLVHGRMEKDSGEIRAPVGRDPVRRVRMKIGGLRPREAETAYCVRKRFTHFTLLDVEPHTGRTHQIRVHLASLRHPVVGDTLYGAPGVLRLAGREQATLDRNFLHAARIEFAHPGTGEKLSFASPLPAELVKFLEWIRQADSR